MPFCPSLYLIIETVRETFTGTLLWERKKLSRLREMARNHEFDVLIFSRFDRLSRNQTHMVIVLEEMQRLGIRVECVFEDLDSTPQGELLRHVMGFVAEIEREKIIERTQGGVTKRLNDGKLLPGYKPRYGYRWIDPRAKKKEACELDEEEAEVVREIYRLNNVERRPVERIAHILSDREVPTPMGKQYWDKSTVYRILTDIRYTGRAMARRDKVERVGGKLQRTRRPDDEIFQLPDGLVPPNIDIETFNEAQEILAMNKMESRRNVPNSVNDLLRCGHVRCGYCGRIMTGSETRSGSRKIKGTVTRFYMCFYKYRSNRRCEYGPSIAVKKIDAIVWEYVGELIKDFTLVEQAIAIAKESGGFTSDLKGIDESIASAKINQDQFVDDLNQKENEVPKLRGRVRSLVLNELSEIEDYLDQLAEERRKIEAGQFEWEKAQIEVDKFVTWCLNARDNYETADYEEKRRVIKMLGICVYVYRTKGDPDGHLKYDIRLKVPQLSDIVLHKDRDAPQKT